MRERKPSEPSLIKSLPTRFDVSGLQKISDDIRSGKLKLKKGKNFQRVSDHEKDTGLKAHVYKDRWSYFVEYKVRGKAGRPQISIGEHPHVSLSNARKIASMIRRLGRTSIDIKDDEQWLENHGIETWRRGEPTPVKSSPEKPLDDITLQELKAKARKKKKRERMTREHIHVQAYPDGKVVYNVEYTMPGIATRMHIKVGEWPEMSIPEVRNLSEIIRELGIRGVDVQWGLHTRLVEELKRDGVNWRPALSEPPTKKR